MANLKSEQIKSDLNLEIALDEPLTKKKMNERLAACFEVDRCSFIRYNNNKILCYDNRIVFLVKAVTYLGGNGQHPIFKKRIQLPDWWKDFVLSNPKYDIRFIGVYHYQNNIVFIDFIKDTYIKNKMHNSSAFVYTNDIYQAMKEGIFSRLDVKGNTRFAIKYTKFKEYILGYSSNTKDDRLLGAFENFNNSFIFNKELGIVDALKTMYETNDIGSIRETEWAGFYLENRMKTFIKDNDLENIIKFVGKSRKKREQLDFDLWFDECQFYGDLKASDKKKNETPGNDSDNFFECINKYDRFWYVVYEHDTEKEVNREACSLREKYLKSVGLWKEPVKHKKPYAYHRPLKLSVNFKSMMILELNRINCHDLLSIYNQGTEPNGEKRNTKVKINKKNVENFIVYNYIAE